MHGKAQRRFGKGGHTASRWLWLVAGGVGVSAFLIAHVGGSGGTLRAVQPAVRVQGELITPVGSISNQMGLAVLEAGAKRHRNAPVPSTQERLVMAAMKQDGLADAQPLSNSAPLTNIISIPPELLPSGYTGVDFERLGSYNFVLSEDVVNRPAEGGSLAGPHSQIPDGIQKLDGEKVGIRGFLLPVRMDDGLAVEFLLLRDRSFCCYGTAPKINQWITVKAKGRGAKPTMDQVITVFGTLHVGEMREKGFLVGVYELEADKILD